jgi:hypothetical protein
LLVGFIVEHLAMGISVIDQSGQIFFEVIGKGFVPYFSYLLRSFPDGSFHFRLWLWLFFAIAGNKGKGEDNGHSEGKLFYHGEPFVALREMLKV